MGVRSRRGTAVGDTAAMRELAELAYPGRASLAVQARLRRLIDVGDRLGMTAGDTARLATETLRAIDAHGEFQPALDDVLAAFDDERIRTEVREPMSLYLDQEAVSALALAVCQTCRPRINVSQTNTESADPEIDEPATVTPPDAIEVTAIERQSGALWPERSSEGFPQISLQVMVWWPGLPSWEAATLTGIVSPSLAFVGDNFTLLIEQEGDERPARTQAAWMLRRDDLEEQMPVYELRASTWEMGDEPHEYRFLVASSSEWCLELHDYLATRWISRGLSPTGPEKFDAGAFGSGRPPVGPFVTRPGATARSQPIQ